MPLAMATASSSSVERDHHLHRAEDFVLRQPVVRARRRDEQRRRQVVAAARAHRRRCSPLRRRSRRRRDCRGSRRRSPSAAPRPAGRDRDRRWPGRPAARGSARPCARAPRRGSCAATRMRELAEQVWPAFWMPALTRNGSARSRSASANTSCGDLPPSSSVTGTTFLAAARWISWPTATEPVNEMWWTPGCAVSAAPASSPRPGTTLSAPAGRPASCGDLRRRRWR